MSRRTLPICADTIGTQAQSGLEGWSCPNQHFLCVLAGSLLLTQSNLKGQECLEFSVYAGIVQFGTRDGKAQKKTYRYNWHNAL